MILTKIKDLGFCHFVGYDEDDRSMVSGKIRRLQITTDSNDDYLKVTSIKLRHLLFQCSEMMGGVRGLESLQTLYYVSTYRCGEELFKEVEELRELRSLGLVDVHPIYVSTLCCLVNKMQHLEKLYINVLQHMKSVDWDCFSPLPTLQKLCLRGKFERFPEWIPKHTNLVKLNLWSSKLTDDPMKPLMDLPNLLSLCLWETYEGKTLHFENGVFQKLKKLKLIEMQSLNSIHIGEGTLPSLKQLELYDIPELKDVPSGMDHLGKLEVFCIKQMPEEFVDRIRENVWIQNNVRKVEIFERL